MNRAEQVVDVIITMLVIASAAMVGEILFAWGLYKSQHSAQVAAQKVLNALSDLKRIEKQGRRGRFFYRAIGCKSLWEEHARLLSQDLVKILTKYPQSQIRREVSLPISRRADALVLVRSESRAACLIYECVLTETQESINNKRRDIENWTGALDFLSQQFAVEIPNFTFVTSKELNLILEDCHD